MCGRYVSATPPDQIAAYFATGEPEALLEPSYNVAPTDDIYAVVADEGERHLDAFHWGLVPYWAKDAKIASRLINARSETLATNNSFKSAFQRRRCLVPADGFYEWAKRPGTKVKQPYFAHHPDGDLYAFAGLWEVWKGADKDQPPLRSVTIITTEANSTMAALHDRMPVILPPSAWDAWLDRDNDDVAQLGKLLVPAPPEVITLRPVSTAVGNVRNNGVELVAEVDPEPSGQLPGLD